jgi:hypothetical protein
MIKDEVMVTLTADRCMCSASAKQAMHELAI